jgi:hypothetical protein
VTCGKNLVLADEVGHSGAGTHNGHAEDNTDDNLTRIAPTSARRVQALSYVRVRVRSGARPHALKHPIRYGLALASPVGRFEGLPLRRRHTHLHLALVIVGFALTLAAARFDFDESFATGNVDY